MGTTLEENKMRLQILLAANFDFPICISAVTCEYEVLTFKKKQSFTLVLLCY